MRKQTTFSLETDNGPLPVTVYEVRPKDVLDLHKRIRAANLPISEYGELLPKCTNLTFQQLSELYPSEIQITVDNFKEVNKSFLAPWPTAKKVITSVGLGEWLAGLIKEAGILSLLQKSIVEDWQSILATLSKKGITAPGTTVGGSST